MKLGLDLSLGCLSALALAVTTAGACGRTDLFSAHGGSNPSCPPSDPTCVGTDGGGLSAGHDGGGGATGAGGRAGNGGGGGKSGNGGGGGKTCPTGNREICGNKIDDDCNGLIDCADPACFGDPSCSKPGQEICNNGIDDNGDGLIDCADPECVNSISCKTTPGTEICNNGIDDNGNGLVDCADPMCTTFPGCLTVDCSPDTDFGTLAIHGANVTRMIDTVGAPSGYATCALRRLGRGMRDDGGFLDTLSAESGKPRYEAELIELFYTLELTRYYTCLLYTSPSPRDRQKSRMPSSA